jgi:S-adenosylmethionine:tRNA ribosyltransferase-isomerase
VSPATLPLPARHNRMLTVSRADGAWSDGVVSDLPARLRAGDLVVVNDAATLPASIPAVGPGGSTVEIRLAGPVEEGRAVLFGAGSWRRPTELRALPPMVESGDVLHVGGVPVRVRAVDPEHPRLVWLDLDPRLVWAHGAPVQYSYLGRPLQLAEVQVPYAGSPWAVEMPSAGRPLDGGLVRRLREAGVGVTRLTHAAGLSSTGDAALDAALPLPERYAVPRETWDAVQAADRVVAVGTSVVRALESAARGPLAGVTDLRIGAGTELRVVDGLLSGMHEPGESHFQLMAAFVDLGLLRRVCEHAAAAGYRNHEFGDATLLL